MIVLTALWLCDWALAGRKSVRAHEEFVRFCLQLLEHEQPGLSHVAQMLSMGKRPQAIFHLEKESLS